MGRNLSSILAAPVPGHLELASPDAATGSACLVFLRHIGSRVSAVGAGPALSHLLRAEVGAPGETLGDQTAVAVDIAFEAPNRPSADKRCKRMRGGLPAKQFLPLRGPAQLPSFGGIDAVDAEPTRRRRGVETDRHLAQNHFQALTARPGATGPLYPAQQRRKFHILIGGWQHQPAIPRARRRQPDSWLAFRPCRRATPATVAPTSTVSATSSVPSPHPASDADLQTPPALQRYRDSQLRAPLRNSCSRRSSESEIPRLSGRGGALKSLTRKRQQTRLLLLPPIEEL